jgi:hypothetical protein
MIREFIVGTPMLEIHQRLRRERLKLIRLIPRRMPNGAEAYVALYVKA